MPETPIVPPALDGAAALASGGEPPRLSILDLLERRAQQQPRAPAIGMLARPPITYGDLARTVARLAERLATLGLGREDRVAIVLPAGPKLAVAGLAVSAGAVAAPLDPRGGTAELDAGLAALGAIAVVVPSGTDGAAARRVAGVRGLPVLELVPLRVGTAGGWDLRGRTGRRRVAAESPRPDDAALLLRTSGTVGAPKLVSLAHDQLCAGAHYVARALALSPQDIGLAVMPLFHVHGFVAGLLASLTAGGRTVCVPEFSPLRFPSWLAAVRPTWYTAVPAVHQAILRILGGRSGRRLTERLRLVRSASAPLPPRLMVELERALGVPVIEAYGMTEAAHQIASNPLPPRPRKPGSVGLPVGVELDVVDERGGRVASGVVGEVVIRGRTIRGGGARSDGWLRTGDAGLLDADGYLFLAGRLDETINRAGAKVAPAEVDAVLLEHPAVADAATVPLCDPDVGEEVAALVVLREPGGAAPEELQEFVAARLAPFKVPRRLALVAEIPRGVTGKVSRRHLAKHVGLTRVLCPAPRLGRSVRERLIAFARTHVAERRGPPPPNVTDDTSLVGSGLFDSLALVDLAAWTETEMGRALGRREASQLAACDTVRDVVGLVEARRAARRRSRAARPPAARAFPEYTFAAYRPELKPEVLALQTHLWGPDPALNAAYFAWKYERNPYADEPLIYCAIRDGQVVGMRGFFGACWELGGAPGRLPALCAGDLVVAPRHRSHGVIPGIMARAHADLARRGHRYLLNLSAGRATYLASLSVGWRTTASVEPLCRRDAPEADLGPSGEASESLAQRDHAACRRGDAPITLSEAPRVAAMAELIARIGTEGRLRHVRDERYFAWRFQNPLSRYRFLFAGIERLAGYLVLQVPAHKANAAVSVVDWEATCPCVRAALLRAAVELDASRELRIWASGVDGATRRLFRRLGFRPPMAAGPPRRHTPTVLVRVLGSRELGKGSWTLGGRSLLDLATWDLRMLYSDAV